jgi:hypothetical protein
MRIHRLWRSRYASVLPALLCACAGGTDTTAVDEDSEPVVVDTDAPDSDPPSVVQPFEPPAIVPLSPADVVQVEQAVEAFLLQALAFDFEPVQTAVANLESVREPGCPALTESVAGPLWVDDCTTSAGRRFFGNFIYLVNGWEDYVDDQLLPDIVSPWGAVAEPGWAVPTEPPLLDAEGYQGFCTVGNDSNTAHFSGEYNQLQVTWEGLAARELLLEGQLIDTRQDEGWVAEGLEPNLRRVELRGDAGGELIFLHGGVGDLSTPWSTVWATEVVLGDAATTDLCPEEAHGLLAVRSPEGAWYDLTFDGDAGGACDGCGSITRSGVEVGTACPDLTLTFPLPAWP